MRRKLGLAGFTTALFLTTCLNVMLVVQSCATRAPQKTAVDLLFVTGKGVNDAYAAYLDGIFSGSIKTNTFPRVSQQYQTFQQLYNLAVTELPGTNGIAAVVGQGGAVVSSITTAKGLK